MIASLFHSAFPSLGNQQCSNNYCRSSTAFKYDEKIFSNDRNQVAAEAIRLFVEQVPLCSHRIELKVQNMTENTLRELIHQCEEKDNWSDLHERIGTVFSNRMNLSTSFLRSEFSQPILIDPISPLETSATPKSRENEFVESI